MSAIATLEELLAHAHNLELEAVERYQELADQMVVHNQPDLVELFRTMVRVESLHVDKVRDLAADRELPRLAPWGYRWSTLESPESVPIGGESYGMTPRRALELVLASEERAYAFFAGVADSSSDLAVHQAATELAEEERQHAALLRGWLARYPAEADSREPLDMDEPVEQD
ncbi:MAG: ferritin family protein [Candidatus Competibacter sp.]|nr:ferritin family protein [Candidatus Competibacter sp.]